MIQLPGSMIHIGQALDKPMLGDYIIIIANGQQIKENSPRPTKRIIDNPENLINN